MAFTPLNSLNAFLVVARHLSFAGAARELGVTTSALSQAVRLLEERVEVALLTRTSRSVALTDAGQRLLEEAGPAVDQALESLRAVRAAWGEVTGEIPPAWRTPRRRECARGVFVAKRRRKRQRGPGSARHSPAA